MDAQEWLLACYNGGVQPATHGTHVFLDGYEHRPTQNRKFT